MVNYWKGSRTGFLVPGDSGRWVTTGGQAGDVDGFSFSIHILLSRLAQDYRISRRI
jgi:hypothetical protein